MPPFAKWRTSSYFPNRFGSSNPSPRPSRENNRLSDNDTPKTVHSGGFGTRLHRVNVDKVGPIYVSCSTDS